MKNNISTNLKSLRSKRSMSQEKLTLDIYMTTNTDISRIAYSKYEDGSSNPKIENLIVLAKYFNVTLDELILGSL